MLQEFALPNFVRWKVPPPVNGQGAQMAKYLGECFGFLAAVLLSWRSFSSDDGRIEWTHRRNRETFRVGVVEERLVLLEARLLLVPMHKGKGRYRPLAKTIKTGPLAGQDVAENRHFIYEGGNTTSKVNTFNHMCVRGESKKV